MVDYAGFGAVVLAAGQSTRMGRPKLTLPWGEHTVIEHVVAALRGAGISDIIVVTGDARVEIEAVLADLRLGLRTVHNAQYRHSEMLVSLQTGTRVLMDDIENCHALLVVLGDQPEIEVSVISTVIETYLRTGKPVVIPSYQMRRGHPWLVDRRLWGDLLSMPPDLTMRDFLNTHNADVAYAEVNSPAILKDLDTPEDYRRLKTDRNK